MPGIKKEELEIILNSTHDAMIAVNDRGIITLPITIPPLSRRKADIPALTRHMLPGFNE